MKLPFSKLSIFVWLLGYTHQINTGAAGIQSFNKGFRSYKSEKKNSSHKSSTCHHGGSIQGLVLPFYYLTKCEISKPPFLFLRYYGNDQQDVCAS